MFPFKETATTAITIAIRVFIKHEIAQGHSCKRSMQIELITSVLYDDVSLLAIATMGIIHIRLF